MRGDMVGNRSRRHAPAFEAESAQWLHSEMPARAFLPLPKFVPVMAVYGNPTHSGASHVSDSSHRTSPNSLFGKPLHNAVLGLTSTVGAPAACADRRPLPTAPSDWRARWMAKRR
jgi:hypothetical protein